MTNKVCVLCELLLDGRRFKSKISYSCDKCLSLLDQLPVASGIYFLEFENGVKIGKALSLRQRFRDYLSPWHKEIKAWEIVIINRNDVDGMEKLFLGIFNEQRASEFILGKTLDDVLAQICCVSDNRIDEALRRYVFDVRKCRSIFVQFKSRIVRHMEESRGAA